MKQTIYEGLKGQPFTKNNRNKFIQNSIRNLMTLKKKSQPNILNLKNPEQTSTSTSTNRNLNLTGAHNRFGFGNSVVNNTERYGFETNTNPLEGRNSIISSIKNKSSQYPTNIPSELPPKYELPNKPPDYKIEAFKLNSTISSNPETRKIQLLNFQKEREKLYAQIKLEEDNFTTNMAAESRKLLSKPYDTDLYEARIQQIHDFYNKIKNRKEALRKRIEAFENYDRRYVAKDYKHLQSPLPKNYSDQNSILPLYTP
jgi:hypothetical protein